MMSTPSKPRYALLKSLCLPCLILVVTLSASELQPLVRPENANCTQLGVFLDIPLARLHELEQQSMTKAPAECFREMCELWLKNEEDRKWSVVFKALEQQSNRRLKIKLERKYKGDDTGDYMNNIQSSSVVRLHLYYVSYCSHVV